MGETPNTSDYLAPDKESVAVTQRCPEGACCGNSLCYFWCGWLQDWWFRQIRQELRGFSPEINVTNVLTYFILMGCIFLGVGIPLLIASIGVHEVKIRYDQLEWDPNGLDIKNVTFEVTETIKKPVYVYYEVQQYYQNQKRYVKSVDMEQLSGDKGPRSVGDSTCRPQQFIGYPDRRNSSYENDGIIFPCGLIAWSNFNDTYYLEGFDIDSTDIAWYTDVDHIYSNDTAVNYNEETSDGEDVTQWRGGNTTEKPFKESQHFMVWMKPDVKPTIRKLYGVIDKDIEKGTYTAQIYNRYNVYENPVESEANLKVIKDAVKKYLVISHKSWYGGSNLTIGICWIVSGGCSLLSALILFFLSMLRSRIPGNMDDVSWVKKEKKLAELHGWQND